MLYKVVATTSPSPKIPAELKVEKESSLVPHAKLPEEFHPSSISYLGAGVFKIDGAEVQLNGGMEVTTVDLKANLVDSNRGLLDLGQIPDHSAEQVHEIKIAREGVKKAWRNVSPYKRMAVMEEIISQFRANKEVLAKAIMHDSSKHIGDARAEVDRTLKFLTEEISVYKEILLEDAHTQILGSHHVMTQRVPVGAVDAIGSNNYVFNEGVMMGLQSLLVGNVIAYKAPRHGQSTTLIAATIIQSELKKELGEQGWAAFGAIFGSGRRTIPAMAAATPLGGKEFTSDSVRYIGGEGGIKPYFDHHPRPFGLKHPAVALGAKNPVIIDETATSSASIDPIAADCVKAALSNSGQRCTAGCPQFVSTTLSYAFLKQAEQQIKDQYKPGMPWEEGAKILPPLDGPKNLKEYQAFIADASDKGANLLAPFGTDILNGVQPPVIIVFDSVAQALEANVVKEEIFGPLMIVIKFDKSEKGQIGEYVTQSEYGHQLSYYGSAKTFGGYALDLAEVDRVHINSAPSRRPDTLRFGNRKGSGNDGPMSGIESVIKETETMVTHLRFNGSGDLENFRSKL